MAVTVFTLWTFLIFCPYIFPLHAHNFVEEVHELRQIIAKNAEMIRFLTTRVNNQDAQIKHLETRLAKADEEKSDLNRRLQVLENSASRNIQGLKKAIIIQENSRYNDTNNVEEKKAHNTKQMTPSVFRRASPDVHVVGFYVYMSRPELNPGPHHTIIFDVEVTDVGNGYNHFSGIYTVPSSGVYVFSWTISCSRHGYIYSHLVVNADAIGGILTNSASDNDHISTTGLVVKEVNQGDAVFVRTTPTGGPLGNIESSSTHQRTSFSGWKLA